MKKRTKISLLTVSIIAAMSMTAFAAGWQQDEKGWWWQNDDGSYPVSTWHWLDGNNDGIAESYYFDANGYMAANTVVNGYTVNADGAWVVDGIVQTSLNAAVLDNGNASVEYIDYVRAEILDILGRSKEEVTTKYEVTKFPFAIDFEKNSYLGEGKYASRIFGSMESILQTLNVDEIIQHYKRMGWEVYQLYDPLTEEPTEILIRPETGALSNAERYEISIGTNSVEVTRRYNLWGKADRL